jgi:chitin synthase
MTTGYPYYYQIPPLYHRQERRYKPVKHIVKIQRGAVVLDCPVPVQYLDKVPIQNQKEVDFMRYTAVTCDPSVFKEKYTLRQTMMQRRTEIMICITMYNVSVIATVTKKGNLYIKNKKEDEILLSRTLHGIMKNISNLTKRTRSRTWASEQAFEL